VAESQKPLSSLSDAELMAQYGKVNKPLSGLSDEELMSQYKNLSQPKTDIPEVLNEGSDIGALDRAAVKNFGGSIEDQVDFLKKRNPNLEVRQWEGEIIAKKPEEKSYKKLDPGGMANLDPREMFKDALDLGTDLGSGALSSIAGAAGAVPGALGGFGVGGIATGAAAAGAASAGLETVKQSIGKALGSLKF
jgi:hypothetical protein